MASATSFNFNDIRQFEQTLVQYNINPSNWRGVATQTLYDEWKSGECILEKKGSDIIRKVQVVSVHCFHTNQNGDRLRLIEEKQIMPNGSERPRGFKFVSETMKPNEDIQTAAKRGLKEELQIDDSELQFERTPDLDEDKTKESTTYVGLKTHYLVYHLKTEIPTRLFKETYKEEEKGVTTLFKWEKV